MEYNVIKKFLTFMFKLCLNSKIWGNKENWIVLKISIKNNSFPTSYILLGIDFNAVDINWIRTIDNKFANHYYFYNNLLQDQNFNYNYILRTLLVIYCCNIIIM